MNIALNMTYCQSISDHRHIKFKCHCFGSGFWSHCFAQSTSSTFHEQHVSNFRNKAFCLFGRSGTTRLEGPEDGRDEDNGDDGGGQDVAQQKQLPVLRVGGIHGDDFFNGSNTQF